MSNFYCGWLPELERWRIETFCSKCGRNYTRNILTKHCDAALRRIRESSNMCNDCTALRIMSGE